MSGVSRGDGRQGEDLSDYEEEQSAGTRLDHCAHALSHPWQAKTTARAQRTAQLRPHHSQTHITSPSPSLPAQPRPARPPPPPSRTPTMPSRPHPPPPPLGCSLTLAVESQPQHTSAAQHTSTTQHETPPTLHSPATANPCAASPTPAVRLPTHAPTDARRRPSQRPDSASLHAMQILPPPDTPSFGHSRQPRYAATAPPPTRTAAPPPPPPSSPPLPLASPPPSPHHAATAPSPS